MTDEPMAECRVPNIDPALWKKVKDRAKYEGRSIRFVVRELLKVYAQHGFKVVETFRAGKNGH